MRKNFAAFIILLLLFVCAADAQQPNAPEGNLRRVKDWFEHLDTNKNGIVERAEFDVDIDLMFKNIDKNGDGIIDENELPPPPPRPGEMGNRPQHRRDDQAANNAAEHSFMLPPPFLMKDAERDGKITRAEFDKNAALHFSALDKNADGVISIEEANSMNEGLRPPPPPPRPGDAFAPPAPPPPPPPTIEFLGAEMRFGDKLVKDAPFSAEIVTENIRRLFDGSTIKTENKGAVYRDSEGRLRREQTLETVGGFSLGGEVQKLIFITDTRDGTQHFLDPNRKTARKISLSGNRPLLNETDKGKSESLGIKTLEGVSVEGTRITSEIPVGKIGNEKPLQVITERWYSSELQTVVMSRHIDPLAGEQIFRLTNIKRAEPPSELFVVPSDYRIENDRNPQRRENRKQ